MYELVQAPVRDNGANPIGHVILGYQIDQQLAERIVNHSARELQHAGKRMTAEPMEVALWHMDGANPHILGLSGTDVPLPFLTSTLEKNNRLNPVNSVEFDAGGYSFITEPFAKLSPSSPTRRTSASPSSRAPAPRPPSSTSSKSSWSS